uniref:Movement protein TGBp3 n=1 Tax=Potato virus M TaxID=12167 RepID=A0A7U0FXL9_9VIRU|nr:triple gene block protein 3 [Potato virus M]
MIAYVLAGLCAFVAVFLVLNQGQSDCIVLITGESVRIQGCVINEHFGEIVPKLKPFGCASFRS